MADKIVLTQVHNTYTLLEGLQVAIEFSVKYQDSNGTVYNWGMEQRTLNLKSGPVFKTPQQLNNEIAVLARAVPEERVEPVGVLAGEFLVGGFSVITV